MISVGTAETVEGGDQLATGLCPLVVVCQSAWGRAGEMLENRGMGLGKDNIKRQLYLLFRHFISFSLLEEKISRR